jgi:DNA-binding beta-propeller fold protein YncE
LRINRAGPLRGIGLSGLMHSSSASRAQHLKALCLALILAMCAACLASSSAIAAGAHIAKSTFGSAGSGDGQLELAEGSGLAVNDTSHDVYVADTGNHRVAQFDSSGTFVRAFGADVGGSGVNVCISGCLAGTAGSAPGAFEAPTFVAIDDSTGDVYVADTVNNLVTKFEADGSLVSSWGAGGQLSGDGSESFGPIAGIVVGASGNLFVLRTGNPGMMFVFDEAGTFITKFSTPRGSAQRGLAIDPGGNFFKANANGSVEKFAADGTDIGQITLLSPTSGVTVDVSSGELYIGKGTLIERYAFGPFGEVLGATDCPVPPGSCPPTELFGLGNLAASAGLAVDSSSHAVYVADVGAAQVVLFELAVLPDVTSEEAKVEDGTVVLKGVVSPAGGPPVTTCAFEYVEASAEDFEGATFVPCSPSPPFTGAAPGAVSAEIQGLAKAAYRFRLVASNENGSSEGKTLFFNTFDISFGLPDGRAYEMITPPQKAGEVLPPEPSQALGGHFDESCPGECLPGINVSQAPMQSAPDGEAILFEGQPFSSGLASGPNEYLARRDASGWQAQSLNPPLFKLKANEGYKGFSEDLSEGIQSQVEPPLSPEAPLGGEGKSFANLYLRDKDGSLQPLVTDEPPNRTAGFNDANGFQVFFRGANAGAALTRSFSHLVFEANDALTEEVPGIAPAALDGGIAKEELGLPANLNLYEWFEGELRLVSVKGANNEETVPGAVLGSGRLLKSESLAIAEEENPNVDHAISDDGSRIFWSEEATGQVYVRIGGEETLEIQDPGKFVTAASDGSKVLLSDGCLYDLEEEECEDLTLDQTEVHQGRFEGILGAAEDLSRVYFVDKAVLTGEEENANEEQAVEGEFNLYLWDRGATSFIATLQEGGNNSQAEDNRIGLTPRFGDWRFPSQNRTAQVSPDGRYLTFMSRAPVTGYDNEVRSGGCRGEIFGVLQPPGNPFICFEVFEYDAEEGKLSCPSCNPSGQQPLGGSNLSLIALRPAYPIVPQPTNLLPDGTLYFESQDELVASDSNGPVQDVYQWKPNGVGGCEDANGCHALISSGNARGDTMFLDATPSGKDVFIITRQQLLPQDRNDQLDIYDARVNGGFAEVPAALCSGETCQGPIPAPTSPPPASAEFNGSGNQNARLTCRKGFVKKHGKCVKKKKRHKKRNSKRSAKHSRGGSE